MTPNCLGSNVANPSLVDTIARAERGADYYRQQAGFARLLLSHCWHPTGSTRRKPARRQLICCWCGLTEWAELLEHNVPMPGHGPHCLSWTGIDITQLRHDLCKNRVEALAQATSLPLEQPHDPRRHPARDESLVD